MAAIDKTKKTRVAIILHCAGPQMLEICDQLTYGTDEDEDDPDLLLKKLEEYCCPRTNEVLQSFRFWKLEVIESFNAFLTPDIHSKSGHHFNVLPSTLAFITFSGCSLSILST